MPFYRSFTSARVTVPDPVALTATVRTAVSDATAGVSWVAGCTVKKATDWTAGDIAAAQTAIDAAAAWTPQLEAQEQIDAWPIMFRAFALELITQLNVLRAFHALAAITPAQALAAIRAKAGQLS